LRESETVFPRQLRMTLSMRSIQLINRAQFFNFYLFERVNSMAHHDENFRDGSGFGWILVNLVALAWITMPASIAWSNVSF
jgi:hypothetical protein